MSCLTISLLGPLQAVRDGEPVTRFGADTAQALLAYLAMHAQTPCRREALAGLLWPDRPQAAAFRDLRQALSRLRQALGEADAASASDPPLLQATRETIQLHLDDLWLDAALFDQALAACRQHAHRRLDACRACMQRLEAAAELCRGEFMAGFSLDSALFEEWLRAEREHYHRQAMEALGCLASYHERRGELERVQRCAERQLALEPWCEGAHRQAMRTLALRGQRDAALAQYETCRRVLAEELGVEPEAETTALWERIGKSDRGLSAVPPHNLPAQLTPFVGREKELAQIEECLQAPACRLLTVVGLGGMGKTRLALEAAAEQAHAFVHGTFLVSLVGAGSADAVVPAIAAAVGFTFPGQGDARRQLLEYLRQKEMLLVLDNFEHLLAGAALVTEILQAAPGVKVLVTSRARLNLRGEQVLALEGMEYPALTPSATLRAGPDLGREEPGDARQYSSVVLFRHSARRVRPEFELADEHLPHVAQICRLVQGMPLAILLAAAWAAALSPAEIAGQLASQVERSLDFLAAGWPDEAQRHRSMRAVLDSCWRMLNEQEQQVFAALSVFRGGFTAAAAQEVARADVRALRSLVDKSFLKVEEGGRYGVHELLRQYGEEQLARTPEEEWTARDRHCAHYAAALARWAEEVKGPRYKETLAELEIEIANAWAAWEWAVAQGQQERLAQELDMLVRFCNSRGRYQEGAAAFEAAAIRLGEAGSGAAHFLLRLTTAQLTLIQDAETWQCLFRRGRDLLARPDLAGQDVRREEAEFCMQVANPTVWTMQWREHLAYAERALALYQEMGDRPGMARVHGTLGFRAFVTSDHDEARRQLEQQRELSRSLGYLEGVLGAIWWLGMVAFSQGLAEECDHWVREWSALLGEGGEGRAGTLWMAGQAHLLSGRYAEAHAALEECAAIYRRSGGMVYLGRMEYVLAQAQLHLGQYDRARASAQEGSLLAHEQGGGWPEAGAWAVLGQVALAEGRREDALELLERAATVWRSEPNRSWLGESLAFAGHAVCRLGREAEARQYLAEALRLGLEVRSLLPLWAALPAVALLLADRGEAERATELYALAWGVPHIARSRWYEEVAGRELAAVAATLPPEVREAALARGRSRDPWASVEELLEELENG